MSITENSPRVLIVEDEDLLAEALALKLEFLGYRSIGRTSFAEEAITMAGALQPDLVLMDIFLAGDMDGITAALAIKEGYDIPVVFLSSFSSEELVDRAKLTDPFGYILKPFSERELRIVIDMALYKHHADARLKYSDSFGRAILDSVSAEIAVLDTNGIIIGVNQAWLDFAKESKRASGRFLADTGIGQNYLTVCSSVKIDDESHKIAEGIHAVLDGSMANFNQEYPCDTPTERRWFNVSVTPLGAMRQGVVVSHTDITERKRIEIALSETLLEKEALLKEVHHRVKNNLQVIFSLLGLEAGRSTQSATTSVLHDMQSRVRTMGLLHESLYRSSAFSSLDLGTYLKQLSTQVFRMMCLRADLVCLELDLASVTIGMDQATPCGLLVNELISNSLKHGFPDGNGGEVRVQLHLIDGTDQVHLKVSDTGIGLSADFEEKRQHSLGLQLAFDLAKQVGGELLISTVPQLSFELTFAIKKFILYHLRDKKDEHDVL
jgi:two-component sensor histidine kinase/response regulator of citrate/malate metabolism